MLTDPFSFSKALFEHSNEKKRLIAKRSNFHHGSSRPHNDDKLPNRYVHRNNHKSRTPTSPTQLLIGKTSSGIRPRPTSRTQTTPRRPGSSTADGNSGRHTLGAAERSPERRRLSPRGQARHSQIQEQKEERTVGEDVEEFQAGKRHDTNGD